MRERSDGWDGLVATLVGKVEMDEAIQLLERGMIQRSLDENGGNQSAASRQLGIHRNTLLRKMTQYGLGEARPRRKPATRAGRASKASRRRKIPAA